MTSPLYQLATTGDINIGSTELQFVAMSDPVAVTAQTVGLALWPLTQAEAAAGLAGDLDTAYPPGDVRRYGATGDGATNDTTAINNALAVAQDVYFPAGTYMVQAAGATTTGSNNGTEGGLTPQSNQKLTLDGRATIKAIANSSTRSNVLRLRQVSNVIIEGGTIQGERAGHSGGTGEWGHGIGIWDCDDVTIRNCIVKDCWGDGIYVDEVSGSPSTNVVITGVRCTNNRRNGCSIISATRVRVSDSTFDSQTGTNPQGGLFIEPDTTKSISDVLVSHCHAYDNVGEGFCATKVNGVSVARITFDACHARNNEYGISLRDVTEAVVSGCVTSDSDLYGIEVDACSRVSISGCTSFDNARDGMRILDAASDIAVSGCNFYSNGSTTYGHGLVAVADATETEIPQRIAVTGCVFRENWLTGAKLLTVKDSSIASCVFSANGQAADNIYANLDLTYVTSVNSDSIVVTGNVFLNGKGIGGLTNGPRYHIKIAGEADNCLVQGNDMTDAAETLAVSVTGGTGNTFRGNKGYATSNAGTGTIDSGTTSETIAHGLNITPDAGRIHVVLRELASNAPGDIWLSGITDTSFTVNVRADPGASNLDFGWSITD